MKQTWAIVVALLLAMPFALAGSISGLDNDDCTDQERVCLEYECDRWWHGHCVDWDCTEWGDVCDEDINTEINDDDVEIDADTVDGTSGDDIRNGFGNLGARMDEMGGGFNKDTLWYLTTGKGDNDDLYDFVYQFYDLRYMPLEQQETIWDRMDVIEAEAILGPGRDYWDYAFYAGMIKAARVGHPVNVDHHTCSTTECIQITSVEEDEKPFTHFLTFQEMLHQGETGHR